jgi:hypothetical protein
VVFNKSVSTRRWIAWMPSVGSKFKVSFCVM